jgi:hypothetical protein
MHRKSTIRKLKRKEKIQSIQVGILNARGVPNKCDQCLREGVHVSPMALRDGTPQDLCFDCIRKTEKTRLVAEHLRLKREKHEIAVFKRGHPRRGGGENPSRERTALPAKRKIARFKKKHPGSVGEDGLLELEGSLPKIPRKKYSLRQKTLKKKRSERQGRM